MHVLVCEDDASVRVVLGRMLERLGCRVTEAENGSEALTKFQRDPADVVLTDMVMPEMDGVETIKAFRKQHPDVRLVAMSGGAMAGAVLYLNLAIQLGASAVLPKPFSVEELTRALGIPNLH
jgi:CheY-like chemotaxis protein